MIETHYECPCLETCPLNRSMEVIGGKWKMQILCALNNGGPTRYNQLKKKMDGVSNTVLAKALKELEEDGLIIRKEYLEVPVRVEYETTPACDELIPILDSLGEWVEKHNLKRTGLTDNLSAKNLSTKDLFTDDFIKADSGKDNL